ncbi:MAG TPA: ABC transporter permease [Clostridiaceae bacterium]|nr:ABC transporter permease [Clostridiaceae bacterium]
MRNSGLVFSFELKSILRKKSYLVTTIILCLIVVAAVVIPTVLAKKEKQPEDVLIIDGNVPSSVLEDFPDEDINDTIANGGYFMATDELKDFPLIKNIKQEYTDEDSLKTALSNDEISYGVVFNSANDFVFMVNGESNPVASSLFEQQLLNFNRMNYFEANQINPGLIDEIYGVQVNATNVDISQKGIGNFALAMIYTFLLYMLIIMYGTTVSTSVAREKDNRTMELLIANTKADYLIIGKTFAAGLAGILQVLALIVTLLISLKFTGQDIVGLIGGFLELNMTTIVTMIIFSLTGYISYLFIYAALGALVSKVEDVNYAVTPVMLIFIAAYLITMLGMENPHNTLLKVASYFPLTSVLAMPVRTILLNISPVEILISTAIMLLSIVVFSILAIRIYRLGSLNYGNRMKFGKTLKMIIRGEGS